LVLILAICALTLIVVGFVVWSRTWSRRSSFDSTSGLGAPRGSAHVLRSSGVVVAAILLVVGSFLPWLAEEFGLAASPSTSSQSGVAGGGLGVATATLGIIGLMAVISGLWRNTRGLTIAALATFAAAAVICLSNIYNIVNLPSYGTAREISQVTVGFGLWLCLAGSVIGSFLCIFGVVAEAQSTEVTLPVEGG
jgi:hypothetical protein